MTDFLEHNRMIKNIQLSKEHRILFMRAFINEINIWMGSLNRNKIEKLICRVHWENADEIETFLKNVFDSYFDVYNAEVGYVEHYMTWIIGIEKIYTRHITEHFGIEEEIVDVLKI